MNLKYQEHHLDAFFALWNLHTLYLWQYDEEKQQFYINSALQDFLRVDKNTFSRNEVLKIIRKKHLRSDMKFMYSYEGNGHVHLYLKREYMMEVSFAKQLLVRDLGVWIGTLYDIREKEWFKTIANRDALTNAYNRRSAQQWLEANFTNYVANGGNYSIIIFDVDTFKTINDTFGHECGDYALKTLCAVVKKRLFPDDLLVRWGGDEFLILSKNRCLEDLTMFAEFLRNHVDNYYFIYENRQIMITISLGVSMYCSNDCDYHDAFQRADRCLYHAKLRGRNTCVY